MRSRRVVNVAAQQPREDVTEIVQRYRLALRHIWNSCFWIDPDLRDNDGLADFRALHQPLFRSIIARTIGRHDESLFGPDFLVEPAPGLAEFRNLMVASAPGGCVWSIQLSNVSATDIKLSLVDLFDWSPFAYIDLRYFRTRIEWFPAREELVGYEALVDVGGTSVYWTGNPGGQ